MTIINKLTEILHFTLHHLCILLAIHAIMPSYLESANEAIAASTANGLADIYSGRTTTDGFSKHVVTKGNAALQATQDIFCTASRDVDAATLLEDAKGVMMDPKATRTALKSALKSIETVQAFLLSSSKSLVTSAKVLAPMSAMLPYHQEVERERVAEAKEEAKKASTKRTTKQPEQMLLENYLESRVEDSSKNEWQRVSCPPCV